MEGGFVMDNKQKQHLLAYLGYYKGEIDGVWGELSADATEGFQVDYGLNADGIFGPATEARILEVIYSGEKPQTAPESGDWWDGIKWFTREEFRCKCDGRFCDGFPTEMKRPVVELADRAREHFGKPALVVSGLRCETHNANEGGVWNSQHMYGEAVDLRINGVSSAELLAFVKQQPETRYAYAINDYSVHMDIAKSEVGR